jgi:hypothetical protein
MLSLLQPAVSSLAVPWQRLLTLQILQLTVLRSLLSSEYSIAEISQFNSAGLGSPPQSLGADPKENTTSHSFYIVVMGGCLAIVRILLTCLPSRYQATHIHSRDRCIATVLHATI